MSIATTKNVDKIKLLDQMLEDMAGDEFEDYDPAESNMQASAWQFADIEELDTIDSMH
jgi:hypothetical protein